jgi:hypothetical protein
MSGAEFWIWVVIYAALLVAALRAAAWLLADDTDADDRLAIGAHRWPIDDEVGE